MGISYKFGLFHCILGLMNASCLGSFMAIFILHAKKTAFVVEHDFVMATYLADGLIVYEGTPFVHCTANASQSL